MVPMCIPREMEVLEEIANRAMRFLSECPQARNLETNSLRWFLRQGTLQVRIQTSPASRVLGNQAPRISERPARVPIRY